MNHFSFYTYIKMIKGVGGKKRKKEKNYNGIHYSKLGNSLDMTKLKKYVSFSTQLHCTKKQSNNLYDTNRRFYFHYQITPHHHIFKSTKNGENNRHQGTKIVKLPLENGKIPIGPKKKKLITTKTIYHLCLWPNIEWYKGRLDIL